MIDPKDLYDFVQPKNVALYLIEEIEREIVTIFGDVQEYENSFATPLNQLSVQERIPAIKMIAELISLRETQIKIMDLHSHLSYHYGKTQDYLPESPKGEAIRTLRSFKEILESITKII